MFILILELPGNTIAAPEIGQYGSNFGGGGSAPVGTPGHNNRSEQFSQLTEGRQSLFGFGMSLRGEEGEPGRSGRAAHRGSGGQPPSQTGQSGDNIEQFLQQILASLQGNGNSQPQSQRGQQRGNKLTRIIALSIAIAVSMVQQSTQTQRTQTAGSGQPEGQGDQATGQGQQPTGMPSIPSVPPPEDTSGAGSSGLGNPTGGSGTGALAGHRNVLPQEGPI